MRQLDDYLSSEVGSDPLLKPVLTATTLGEDWPGRAADVLREHVRPALGRLRAVWANELLPVARDDDHIGLCHIPGGEQAYDAEVRAFTTTSLSGQEIHRLAAWVKEQP